MTVTQSIFLTIARLALAASSPLDQTENSNVGVWAVWHVAGALQLWGNAQQTSLILEPY